MSQLKGCVAVITGGAGDGIGRGISMELAKAGARIAIVDLDALRAQQLRDELKSAGSVEPIFVRADVSSEEQVEAACKQIARETDTIDILVNSAGIGLIRAPHEATLQDLQQLFAVDFQGVWLCCKHTIPLMQRQKRGVIINIGSVHGSATLPNYSLYAGMKAGLAGFTRGLAVQYGHDGIRANLISPGLVDGSQTRSVLERLQVDPQQWIDDFVRRHQALPYSVTAEDIGKTVAFLASDDAKAITGIEIAVDAGTLAQLSSRD